MRPHDDGRYHGIKVYKIYSPTSGNESGAKFNPQYIEWYKRQDPLTQRYEHYSVLSRIHPDIYHSGSRANIESESQFTNNHNYFLSPQNTLSFNRRGRYEPWF